MSIAVISDIHGNLHALEAVGADLHTQGCTEIVCLGDIVGYGAYPVECLEWVRSNARACVRGNHEEAILEPTIACLFNQAARAAINWTRRQGVDQDWLAKLPYEIGIDNVLYCHGSPKQPRDFAYVQNECDAESTLKATPHLTTVFIGHTHRPVVYQQPQPTRDLTEARYIEANVSSISLAERAMVNVGSVGQPRARSADACYVIFEPLSRSVSYRFVPYDVEGAYHAILAAGLPRSLAERLRKLED